MAPAILSGSPKCVRRTFLAGGLPPAGTSPDRGIVLRTVGGGVEPRKAHWNVLRTLLGPRAPPPNPTAGAGSFCVRNWEKERAAQDRRNVGPAGSFCVRSWGEACAVGARTSAPIQRMESQPSESGGRMRKIGLLGGMSWESTAEYYRLLNEGVQDALGGLHSARIVLSSVDFAGGGTHASGGQLALEAGSLLAAEARGLEAPARTWCCSAPTRCTESPTPSRAPSPSSSTSRMPPPTPSRPPASPPWACWAPPSRWSRTSTADGSRATA